MNSFTRSEYSSTINHDNQQVQYRSVSKSAVACLVFTALGLLSFLTPAFVLLPALGVAFGVVAWFNFRRYPDELVGKLFAQIGLVISLVCLIASVVQHVYIYNTELPDGYERISYSMLRDNPKTALPFSEAANDLDGKKVFLKGYVRPGDKKNNLKNFILVGDFGDCCFGGNPKISEVVAIKIVDPEKTVNYGYALRRIGGKFQLNPQTKVTSDKDIPQVFYEIEADHVK